MLRSYSLFNLRRLDETGAFDRFDLIPPENISSYRDAVAASPHGWCDIALVAHNVVDSAPMRAFLEAYRASGR
jgi:hypothetical protein